MSWRIWWRRCAPALIVAVRLALGADHGGVLRLVMREGALLVVFGLLAGLPGVYFGGRDIG